MLNGMARAQDPVRGMTGAPTGPTTQVVLHGFEDHSQSTASQPAIGRQLEELRTDLLVVGPVSARSRLAREPRFDQVTGSRPVR